MKIINPRALSIAVALAAAELITGCDSSSDNTGIVSFGVTDAPADNVARVQLTLTSMTLKPDNGPPIPIHFPEPVVIDNLLDLQGGNAAALLGNTRVPAGHYQWVRLYVLAGGNDSFVVDDAGVTWDLLVPGQQSGGNPKLRYVQLVSGFVVPVGGDVDYTIDVDLQRALTKPASADHYFLRPAMRIVDNSMTGTLAGTVDPLLLLDPSCTSDTATGAGNSVYLYSGTDAATGDIWLDMDGNPLNAANPAAVAPVRLADNGGQAFRFGFVAAGDYTLAFTCQGLDDHPDTDDVIAMTATANVSVTANATTTVSLVPPIP